MRLTAAALAATSLASAASAQPPATGPGDADLRDALRALAQHLAPSRPDTDTPAQLSPAGSPVTLSFTVDRPTPFHPSRAPGFVQHRDPTALIEPDVSLIDLDSGELVVTPDRDDPAAIIVLPPGTYRLHITDARTSDPSSIASVTAPAVDSNDVQPPATAVRVPAPATALTLAALVPAARRRR